MTIEAFRKWHLHYGYIIILNEKFSILSFRYLNPQFQVVSLHLETKLKSNEPELHTHHIAYIIITKAGTTPTHGVRTRKGAIPPTDRNHGHRTENQARYVLVPAQCRTELLQLAQPTGGGGGTTRGQGHRARIRVRTTRVLLHTRRFGAIALLQLRGHGELCGRGPYGGSHPRCMRPDGHTECRPAGRTALLRREHLPTDV